MIAAKTWKGGQNMKQAKEAACMMKTGVMPFRMRQGKRGTTLTVKLAMRKAGQRTGRTLRITNQVIPVTKSADSPEEVFFPVKILQGKVEDNPRNDGPQKNPQSPPKTKHHITSRVGGKEQRYQSSVPVSLCDSKSDYL